VGLGTLGTNLALEGGARSSALGPAAAAGAGDDGIGSGAGAKGKGSGTNGEEWDMVRKEVRAIKGMLLNRRNFS